MRGEQTFNVVNVYSIQDFSPRVQVCLLGAECVSRSGARTCYFRATRFLTPAAGTCSAGVQVEESEFALIQNSISCLCSRISPVTFHFQGLVRALAVQGASKCAGPGPSRLVGPVATSSSHLSHPCFVLQTENRVWHRTQSLSRQKLALPWTVRHLLC